MWARATQEEGNCAHSRQKGIQLLTQLQANTNIPQPRVGFKVGVRLIMRL